MSIDGWQPPVDVVTDRWRTLEQDWQSVLASAMIAALVAVLEVPIPW